MGHLFAYSLYSGIILLALYLAYKWVLAGENQHRYNRVALWSIYAVALMWVPLTAFVNRLGAKADITYAAAGDVSTADIVMTVTPDAAATGSTNIAIIILWIYVIGMFVTAVITAIGLLKLIHITTQGTKISVDDTERYEIVVIDDDSVQPFSWHRYIVMSRSDMESAGNIIITHELAHLNHCHWVDLLVSQIVATILWYNPAAWLMRQELSTVHEYQADEAVLNSGITMRDYQMLLIKKAVGDRFQSLANSLNHSKLKKRITMMYNQKKSARRLVRGLVFVPALAAAIAAVNIPAVASAIDDASESYMVKAAPAGAHNGKVSENAASEQAPDKKIWETVEQPPQYPGGEAALMKCVGDNLRYPPEAMEKNIQGIVILQFVVDENGKVTDPKVMRSKNPALDAEALRVVKLLGTFTPGKQAGQPVSVYYTLPIRFKLKNDAPADSIRTADKATTKTTPTTRQKRQARQHRQHRS